VGVPPFGRVIGIIAIHKSLGYLILMGDRHMIRDVGASRRIATGVIVVTVAVLLIAVGCDSEPTPSAVAVAAGDIASCRTEGDGATAELVEGIDGTVLPLGDEAYPRGATANFEECYGPSWGRFKGRTKPVPGNHEYYTEGARGYFEYFGEAAGDPEGGYYSYELGSWHVVALNSNCEEVRCGPGSPQTRWLKEDLAGNDGTDGVLKLTLHPKSYEWVIPLNFGEPHFRDFENASTGEARRRVVLRTSVNRTKRKGRGF
jgi:hypothetical protein